MASSPSVPLYVCIVVDDQKVNQKIIVLGGRIVLNVSIWRMKATINCFETGVLLKQNWAHGGVMNWILICLDFFAISVPTHSAVLNNATLTVVGFVFLPSSSRSALSGDGGGTKRLLVQCLSLLPGGRRGGGSPWGSKTSVFLFLVKGRISILVLHIHISAIAPTCATTNATAIKIP